MTEARRAQSHSIYLARLLADVPRERRPALGQLWGLKEPDERGWVAALYRQMTDVGIRQDVVARLSDAERLVFEKFVLARKPLSRAALLRALPFSEESIESSLSTLQTYGLVWKHRLPGREQLLDGQYWFVPLEMCDHSPPRQPPTDVRRSADPKSESLPSAPGLRVLDQAPTVVLSAGAALQAITVLDSADERSEIATDEREFDLWTYAEHCGVALGVWTRDKRGLKVGPRIEAWRRLSIAERTRAVARLWLVDEKSPFRVPGNVRRAFWATLRSVDANTWYDLNSLARYVAWRASSRSGRAREARATESQVDAGHAISRRDLETAVRLLRWIGVLAVADDARGRPLAIQLTKDGQGALTGDADGAVEHG
jgi:hypothetical protein